MKKTAFILLSIILLFSSCSYSTQSDSEKCTLYYFKSDDMETIIPFEATVASDSPENMVRHIFSMLSQSDEKSLTPIITPNIKLLDVSVNNKLCKLFLSERYEHLSADAKVAFDAALVKSLCSLSFVDKVSISCSDTFKEYAESDFVTKAPRTHYDTYTVNLYFADIENNTLKADREIISLAPDTTLEYAVVSRLLKGPSSDKLKSAIPAGTKLNNVYVSEGICCIDLSAEFLSNVAHDKKSETLAVYSIVNTITELPMIDSVKFLINGNDGYGYAYHDISKPLTNDSSSLNRR